MRIKVDGNDFSRIDGRGRPSAELSRKMAEYNRISLSRLPPVARERLEELQSIQQQYMKYTDSRILDQIREDQQKGSHKHNK